MRDLFLYRVMSDHESTVGMLYGLSLPLVTLELPWRSNARNISCVPAGIYELVKHASTRWPETWALEGRTVSHYKSQLARYACLFHPSKTVQGLQGCISLGTGLSAVGGHRSVVDYDVAFDLFLNDLRAGFKHRMVVSDLWANHLPQRPQ